MATSGTLYTNYVSYNGGSYTLTTRLKITWTRTSAPVSENASYITVTGVMESNMSSGYVRGYRSQTLTINGQRALYEAYKATGTNYGGGETVFQVTNFKIPHNDDGTKTFTMSYEAYVGSTSANQWINNQPVSITLDSIARASSFTLTSSSIYSNGTIGMSISRASTSFTHDISISYAGITASLGTGIGTSLSVAVPSAIKTKMKTSNVTQATCTITVTTKNGSTAVGSKTGNILISAPTATVSTTVTEVAVNSSTANWSLGNTDTSLCTYAVTRRIGSIGYTDQNYTDTQQSTSKSNLANTEFLNAITTSTRGTVPITVYTYVGTALVGSSNTSYDVTIPDTTTYQPSVSLASGYPKRYNDNSDKYSVYLAGYSGAQWQATGTAKYNASIVSMTSEMKTGYGTLSNTISSDNRTITVTISKLPANANNYDEKIRIKATDSRGLSSYIDSTISVSGYHLPVFDMDYTWAKRANSNGVIDNEGTYANLSAKATSHSNADISKLEIKTGNTSIQTVTNTTAGVKTLDTTRNTYGTYATNDEGSFKAIATDSFGKSSEVSFILPKAAVHLSLYEGNPGVGIGTIAEENHLVTALPIITTRTDILHYRNTYGAFNLLFTKDGPDKYGIGVGLGAGGTTVVGGGESASAALNEANASHENLWLTADNVIYICTNANTWSSRKTITVNTSGQITGGTGGSWISGRANALVVNNSNSSGNTGSFYPVATTKSATGAWSIGTLGDSLYFSFTTDSNYSAGSNTASSYYISTGGWFSGTANKADSATNATNVGVTNKNVSTGEWFYVPWINNLTTANQAIWANNGFRYYTLEGTASTVGASIIQLGNSTASGTAGNKNGRIRLYSSSSGYADIYMTATTSNRSIYFPDQAGTLAINAVTTATGVVTKSSGGATLKSSTINIFGKVAQLNVVLTGPSGSQADGTKIFVGTISTAAYRPKASARGCDTYGTSALIGWITTGGEVNIRVMDAGAYDTELEMAFTYIIP